jgi:hypothetical protein
MSIVSEEERFFPLPLMCMMEEGWKLNYIDESKIYFEMMWYVLHVLRIRYEAVMTCLLDQLLKVNLLFHVGVLSRCKFQASVLLPEGAVNRTKKLYCLLVVLSPLLLVE